MRTDHPLVRVVRAMLLACLACLAVLVVGAEARAGVITVGPGCSLGQAILAANSDLAVGACAAGNLADTIQIPPGTITFTNPWSLTTDPNSALPYVTGDTGFVGAGLGVTTLKRDPLAPPFRILQVSVGAHIFVKGITFEGGKAPAGYLGGAIEGYGGGQDGALTIEDAAFIGNEADDGGAIAWTMGGGIAISGSRFERNLGRVGASVLMGQYMSGGFTLTGSTVDANTGWFGAITVGGGGVNGDVLLDQNVVSGNITTGNVGYSGVWIVGATGTTTVTRTHFIGNAGGAALYLGGQGTTLDTRVEDCTFEGNTSSQSAAALVAVLASPFTLRGTTFTDNAGFYQGGAAFIGAVQVTGSTTVEDCTFTGNTSTQGGAAFVTGSGLTTFDGCTFDHNRATTIPGYTSGSGGALFIGGPTQITASVFANNDDPFYAATIAATAPEAAESGAHGELTVSLSTRGSAIYSDGTAYSVSGSCFVGNAASAVQGRSDARSNWWGAADGPSGGGPGSGDTIVGDVTHLPFLTAAPVRCAGLVPELAPVPVNATVLTTGGSYATPGADYAALTIPFQVDPAKGALALPIVAVNDGDAEGVEVVQVVLDAGDRYIVQVQSAQVNIADDGTGCGESCDDGVTCTTDACDPQTLHCTHTPVNGACDDGKACTVDTCTLTGCSHVAQNSLCNDGNPCTSDTCSAGTCVHADLGGTCDDGNPCTTGTVCQGGTCVGGSVIPGCEVRSVDLGAPFGEVLLPVPTGDVCFSGTKVVNGCAPLGTCNVSVEACFYPNDTLVDVVVDTGLGLWGQVPFHGRWNSGGFCLFAELPELGDGAVLTTDGSLMACWDGAGHGSLHAQATAQSSGGASGVSGVSGTRLSGTLAVDVATSGGGEVVTVSGCLDGETADTGALFAGLPGTFTHASRLTVCVDGHAVVHLREWRPLRDDPSMLVTDVAADFYLDALGRWQVRIDQVLDPVISLCRFLLKAGHLVAERLDQTHWNATLRGVASFDVARQHVEAEVIGSIDDGGVTLELESRQDLDLSLEYGNPTEEGGRGILVVLARGTLQQRGFLALDRPRLPTMHLACAPAETTVDFYGTTTLPLCTQTLRSTVTVHAELGEPGFTLEGSVSVAGFFHFPTPLLMPGLPPLPGPYCLGMASEAPANWTVCGAPPEDGLWLHTRTRIPLLGTDADVVLRAELDPPETAHVFAGLAAPLQIVRPEQHVPGITSITVGAGELELNVAACGSGASGLRFQTEAAMLTTRGNTVTAAVAAEVTTERARLQLHTKGRWVEPFALPNLAIEQGADLVADVPTVSAGGPVDIRVGFDGLAFLKVNGSWPAEVPYAPDGEICDDLPARDEDGDGRANCVDTGCADHLFCRAGESGGNVVAQHMAFYFDSERKPGPLGVRVPGLAVRFDTGRSVDWRVGVELPRVELDRVSTLAAPTSAVGPDYQGESFDALVDRFPSLETLVARALALQATGAERAWEWLRERSRDTLELYREALTQGLLTQYERETLAGAVELDVDALPDVCDLLGSACPPGQVSFAPAALSARGLSVAFSLRDAVFGGRTYAAGIHVTEMRALDGGTLHTHGSFGPQGLTLAGYVTTDPGSVANLFSIALPTGLLRLGISGDPYDRVASFPPDLTEGIRVGPAAALDITHTGTVEGTVSRTSWTEAFEDAQLASRASGARGWRVSLGNSDGTGFARVQFEVWPGTGLGLPYVIRTALPVVPPARETHVAVTWDTVQVDGHDVLDVAIYVDGQRQLLEGALWPPPPPDVANVPVVIGSGLGTLDDFRLWKEARPALRIAGESVFMPPISEGDPDLIVRYDFDADLGRTAQNGGATGSALTGSFTQGVRTELRSNVAHVVTRFAPGDAGGESSGLDLLGGFRVATRRAEAWFRVEAHAARDEVTAAIRAQEVRLFDTDSVGVVCLRDIAASADLLGARASGSAELALCRDDGNIHLGEVEIDLGCPIGRACPNPPDGLVATATGTIGPVAMTPAGAPTLTISGQARASTDSTTIAVQGRLATDAWTFDGAIALSETELRMTTTVDLPPLFGVDLGPASCELVYDAPGHRFCGSCVAENPACSVSVCLDVVSGDVTSTPPTCSGVVLEPLPDGSPCASDGMCASGHCNLICYQPGMGGVDSECHPGIADECANDLVCTVLRCPEFLMSCIPAKCRPRLGNGDACSGNEQCPDGMECRPPGLFLSRECLWPRGSRQVGDTCGNADECASWSCIGGADGHCQCLVDSDCGGGQVCTLGACLQPPEPPRLPGQACSSDSQCLLGQCNDGTCGCAETADCSSSSYYCGLPGLQTPVAGALPVGVCLRKRPDGDPCASGAMCSHDHCAGTLRPPSCYGTSSAGLGSECVANDHCRTGRCQLTCNWGGLCLLPSAPLSGPPDNCVCTTTCACDHHGDCASGQYCGVLAPGLMTCKDKKSNGFACTDGAECQSGNCTGFGLVKRCAP